MADYERYSRHDRDESRNRDQNRDRNQNRFQDERLDDRTGYGMGSAGGYRPNQGGVDQGVGGYGQRNYGDYGRDDAGGSTYGGYEERSFGQDASESGGYYGAASGGQDAYGGQPYGSRSAREYQTNRGSGRQFGAGGYEGQSRNYSGEPTNRADYGQGGSRDRHRQSYNFNPYQNYDQSFSGNFGFGELNEGRDEDMNRGRSEGRGHRGFMAKASDRVQSWLGDDSARERLRGDHAGRGPKGYKRSDDRIREDVSDRLADDSWLDASDIEVVVAEAEVTLVGTVVDRDAKRRAESLAELISGVTHVQNNLRVSQLNKGVSSQSSTQNQTGGEMGNDGHNPALTKQAAGRA